MKPSLYASSDTNKLIPVLSHDVFELIASKLSMRDLMMWRSTCKHAYAKGKAFENRLIYQPENILALMFAMDNVTIMYFLQYYFPLNGQHEKTLADNLKTIGAVALYALVAPLHRITELHKDEIRKLHEFYLNLGYSADTPLLNSLAYLLDTGEVTFRVARHTNGYINNRAAKFAGGFIHKNATAINLNECIFNNVNMREVHFSHCSFSGATISQCNLLMSKIRFCNLFAATIANSQLSGSVIAYCNVTDTVFLANKVKAFTEVYGKYTLEEEEYYIPHATRYHNYKTKDNMPTFFRSGNKREADAKHIKREEILNRIMTCNIS